MFKTMAVVVLGFVLAACGNAGDTGQAALTAVQGGALLVDVRTAEEFATGHLPGAINISHGEIVEGLTALNTAKSTEVVLYCRSGNRSGMATSSLAEAGFSNAMNAGGYSSLKPFWDAAGS